MSKSTSRPSAPARVGDARKSKGNTFSQLAALSDSEETAVPCLQTMIAADPFLQAMMRGDVLWGDLAYEEELAEDRRLGRVQPVFDAAARRQAEQDALSAQEAVLWDQPFARNLEMYWSDAYDLRALTDAEYEACMSWLYDQGWEVQCEDRNGFQGWPLDLPPRVWVTESRAPSRFMFMCHQETPAPVRAGKKSAVVPRFCRASCGGVRCEDATCRYVHADTMPRLDKPCGFGAACGGTDPSKRALCLYMHPGETWSADLVVKRPQPQPQPATAESAV